MNYGKNYNEKRIKKIRTNTKKITTKIINIKNNGIRIKNKTKYYTMKQNKIKRKKDKNK